MNPVAPLDSQASAGRQHPVALIVEDEMLVRMVLVDTLMDDGFEVIEATSADEALLALNRRDDVDLVISDVEMPGSINGFTLARRVAEERPNIGIIIVSGRASPQQGDLPEGANFIAKPFYPDTVLTTANAMIGR
ncbi:response regulator transcription factor [Microvirga lenta]|uniref:response regulator transcription factor n=1 Tax=Microvirga lenta TaxID=2881337 RepID=UPI001CFFF7A1|nr:response regulator [Microvirga lenta]MCB5176628.1 response regulator [Microvirga lenta]